MPAGAPEWRTAPAPRPVREPQTASGPVVWNLAQQAMLPVVRQSFYPAYPSRFALMAPKLPNEYSYDTGKLYRGFSRHLDASAPRHLDASLQGPASQATDQVASVGASASHGASVLTRPASRESSVCVDFDPVDTFQPEVVDAAPHAPAKPVYRPHTPIAKSFGDYANLHRPSSAGPVTSATARGYAPTRPPSGAASRHADRKCLDHLLATALPGRTISTSSRRPPDDETGHFAAAVPAPTAPAPRHASLRALRPPSAGAAAAGAAAARQGRFRRPATASALPRMQSWQLAMQHGGTAQHGGAPQHAGVASPRRFDTDDTPFEAERPAHAQRASDGSDFSARDGASNLLQGNCLHGDCLHGDCLHGDWLDPAIRNLLDDTANDARVPTILCAVPLHLVASNSRLPCDAYVLRVVSALKSHDGRLAEKLAPKTDFAQWVTFSRHGAVYHRRGEAQADDFVSLKQWSYEAKTHRKLVEKKTFSQFKARKYFNAWKGALPAAARKRRTRGLVANSLLSEPKLAAVLSFAMDSLANFQDESGRLGEWADGDEEPLDSHGFMLHHLSSCKRLHDFAVDMVSTAPDWKPSESGKARLPF
ncbi:hypothetical protein M885DRAFT_21590 [Pelagophyceae sp. CCMP2097]|nr:hypothetical protein M885DRAFT_21590 [Pelagophyceae sp. CCMP2097]